MSGDDAGKREFVLKYSNAGKGRDRPWKLKRIASSGSHCFKLLSKLNLGNLTSVTERLP